MATAPDKTDAPAKQLPPYFDRKLLCSRWLTSVSTLKRMEKCGELQAITFGKRQVRYAASSILKIEENR
jgi:hypothetical protein